MNALAIALMLGGAFFLSVSAVGVLRLPDFFSRTHAAGKSETLGALLLLVGLAVYQGVDATSFKLVFILFIVAVTGPTGVHALTRAALRSGIEIWVRPRVGETAAEVHERAARESDARERE